MNRSPSTEGSFQEPLETLLKEKALFPFIAPPNGGKGTQTVILSRLLGIPKLDTGGLLRRIAREESDLGREIRTRQNNGQLVDAAVVLAVLKSELLKIAAGTPNIKGFILDGFPRNLEQADGLISMSRLLGAKVAKAFYLKVQDSIILERATNRRICSACGAIYNLISKPPLKTDVCDLDGASLFQREDDQPEKVHTRLSSFVKETRPMIARFRQQGVLVKLDGNLTVDEVTHDILESLRGVFPEVDDLDPAHGKR